MFDCENLQLTKGLFALVGRNGSGKSTFLNCLQGEHELKHGVIKVNHKDVYEFELNELSKTISIVRSKPLLYGDYGAGDILMLGRLPYQKMLSIPSIEDHEIIDEISDRLGVKNLLKRDYNLLSDGEKQLIMVGRAMVQDTPIVLLDEPTAFLDLVNRTVLLRHLKRLADEKNKLIIFSTHHVEILSQYCDGLLLINDKKLKYNDKPETFEKDINEAFELNHAK